MRTPTVLQMEVVECGAAARAIVLGHFGRFVSLEALRLACGVSRDGTKASNVVKAARQYGLQARGFSKEPDDLDDLPLPMIAFWNFNHFVVIEGFGRGKVYLNDPAFGPRVVSDDEFSDAFTGVVLTFEPGPDSRRDGQPPGLLGPLSRRLAGSEFGLLYVVLTSLLLALPSLLVPVFTEIFVDQCLIAGRQTWLGPLLLGMGITAALRAALTWLQGRSLLRLETKLAVTSSYCFFRHVLRLPIEFFAQRYAGEIGARVAINDRIAQLLSRELANHFLNALTATFYVALMLFYDPLLTAVGVLLAGLNFAALRAVGRRRRDENLRLLQERAKLAATSMAGLQAIESLKAAGAEADFFSRWSALLAQQLRVEQGLGLYTLGLRVVPPLLSALASVGILGVGALRVLEGSLTVGMLVAFQGLMMNFLTPVGELVGLGGSLQEVEGDRSRLDDVLRTPCEDEEQPSESAEPATSLTPAVGKLAGQVELRGVTFGYSRLEPPLIVEFSLVVKPGSRVALVGFSASGKSTVAKLVAGLYQPWSGEVLLDGQPSRTIPRAVRARSLALVDQDFFLLAGTVREGLTLWDTDVPEEDVIQAAKDACIHEEIVTRPGAYGSRVEEGGTNFSGGQRQRLEIARALVGNPSVLVLDEATSALDPVTEKQIDDNLRRRGCTCLIVAHRLSTIRDCDEILVLDRGRIAQRGTHEALVAEGGIYRRLVEA